jgi:hypothetical protein
MVIEDMCGANEAWQDFLKLGEKEAALNVTNYVILFQIQA